jgi:hypothetical protein
MQHVIKTRSGVATDGLSAGAARKFIACFLAHLKAASPGGDFVIRESGG